MDATPAHDWLGPGAPPDIAHSPSTGLQPIWTFTEGVTGPVSRVLLNCNVNRRVRKRSTPPAKLVRRQDRRSKHTPACGTASTRCSQTSPLDKTQDLLEALPGMTTQADRVVIQEMHLSMSEAAIFVHHELETSRQSIWAQMLNLYDVDCLVNLRAASWPVCLCQWADAAGKLCTVTHFLPSKSFCCVLFLSQLSSTVCQTYGPLSAGSAAKPDNSTWSRCHRTLSNPPAQCHSRCHHSNRSSSRTSLPVNMLANSGRSWRTA